MARISVIVPSYNRAESLRQCLGGLARQERRADEVIVVARTDDARTIAVAQEQRDLPLRIVGVERPGQVAALNAALAAATGAILAFTDDDAIPRANWLAQIEWWFAVRPDVGGVGGRDDVHPAPPGGWRPARTVGRVTRMGRLVGNHHRGVGAPREVEFIKGANMAFRASAVEGLVFDERLRGTGTQLHNDTAFSLQVSDRGWKLIWDPAVRIDHYAASPVGGDHRSGKTELQAEEAAFNLAVALGASLPLGRRIAWRIWSDLVGDRQAPGVVHALRSAPAGPGLAIARMRAARRGRRKGLAALKSTVPGSSPERVPVVLIAHDVGGVGGMERALGELITRGAPSVQYTVVSDTLAPELRPLVNWIPARAPKRPFSLRFLGFAAAAAWKVARLGALRKAAVVHTTGAIVPTAADVATVHFCHRGFLEATGSSIPPGLPRGQRLHRMAVSALARAGERWCYRPARLGELIAVSEAVAAELRSHYPGLPVSVVPNGVDLDRFRPSPEARSRIRAELGILPESPVVLFVGGDWERKGLEILIGAFASLPFPEAELIVVGPGDQLRLRTHARALGIEQRIHVLGRVPDVAAFYAASDVLALPSLYETFALVVYEAAACGTAVCATRVGGVTDLISDRETGVLVTADVDSVAEGLTWALEDPGRRSAMAERARVAVQELSWDRSVTAMVDLYRRLQEGLEPA